MPGNMQAPDYQKLPSGNARELSDADEYAGAEITWDSKPQSQWKRV